MFVVIFCFIEVFGCWFPIPQSAMLLAMASLLSDFHRSWGPHLDFLHADTIFFLAFRNSGLTTSSKLGTLMTVNGDDGVKWNTEGIAQHSGNYAYLLLWLDLDEKIYTTRMFVKYEAIATSWFCPNSWRIVIFTLSFLFPIRDVTG